MHNTGFNALREEMIFLTEVKLLKLIITSLNEVWIASF